MYRIEKYTGQHVIMIIILQMCSWYWNFILLIVPKKTSGGRTQALEQSA